MSRESMEWLNTKQLVGFSDKRGNAWHYRKEFQGDEPNHYPGPVPVADVLRRLFNFEVVEKQLYVASGADFLPVPDRKAIAHGETGEVFGVFKDGFQIHQYPEWLINNVSKLIGENTLTGIGSAGLLKGGAQAYVQIEVPDSYSTPEGVEYRPNLLASTACDGTLCSTYKRTITVVVCDNTREMALGERGQQIKVKHSRYSHLRIESAREALSLIDATAEDFAAEVAALCEWEVTDSQWDQLLTQLIPDDSNSKRGATVRDNKRDALSQLYAYDARVAPWSGTAFGVVQAWNTYAQHTRPTRGGTVRAERNVSDAITGATGTADKAVLSTLAKLQGRELVLA